MSATLDKQQNKKQEHLKIERFLLKQACNCPQKLADFYRNVVCFHIEGNKQELAEEKYNLLADNETVKFFFDLTEKLNLDKDEEKEQFINCVKKHYLHSYDLEIIETINSIFYNNDIAGWFYAVWSFVEDSLPIAFLLPFDEKEKEVIKFLLYKGDIEAATDLYKLPTINNCNVFISNFILKTCSHSLHEGLFKVYTAHCTQSENLNTLETIMDFNCALSYKEIDLERISDSEQEYMKSIIEGVIHYDYEKQQTVDAKAEYLKTIAKHLDESDKRFIDDLTGTKRFSNSERTDRLFRCKFCLNYFSAIKGIETPLD